MKKPKTKYNLLDGPRIGFELLSLFDWISPILSSIDLIRHDAIGLRSWAFFIPNTEAIHRGWSSSHIKALLKDYDIQVYGCLTNFGEFNFCVSIKDAYRAEQVLTAYGIPITPRSQGAPRV